MEKTKREVIQSEQLVSSTRIIVQRFVQSARADIDAVGSWNRHTLRCAWKCFISATSNKRCSGQLSKNPHPKQLAEVNDRAFVSAFCAKRLRSIDNRENAFVRLQCICVTMRKFARNDQASFAAVAVERVCTAV